MDAGGRFEIWLIRRVPLLRGQVVLAAAFQDFEAMRFDVLGVFARMMIIQGIIARRSPSHHLKQSVLGSPRRAPLPCVRPRLSQVFEELEGAGRDGVARHIRAVPRVERYVVQPGARYCRYVMGFDVFGVFPRMMIVE